MDNTITLKKFKDIVTSKEDFRSKVWNRLVDFGWSTERDWLDESKTYYNNKVLYNLFANEYNNIFVKNEENDFCKLLTNRLVQLLPEVYFWTLILKNATLQKINWESILATTTESGFRDDRNILESFSGSSESPDNTNAVDNWVGEKATTKDFNKVVDRRLTVSHVKDVTKAINDIAVSKVSGVLMELVKHISIRSLFDFNATEETIVVIKGIDGKDGVDGKDGAIFDTSDFVNKTTTEKQTIRSAIDFLSEPYFGSFRILHARDLLNLYTKPEVDAKDLAVKNEARDERDAMQTDIIKELNKKANITSVTNLNLKVNDKVDLIQAQQLFKKKQPNYDILAQAITNTLLGFIYNSSDNFISNFDLQTNNKISETRYVNLFFDRGFWQPFQDTTNRPNVNDVGTFTDPFNKIEVGQKAIFKLELGLDSNLGTGILDMEIAIKQDLTGTTWQTQNLTRLGRKSLTLRNTTDGAVYSFETLIEITQQVIDYGIIVRFISEKGTTTISSAVLVLSVI